MPPQESSQTDSNSRTNRPNFRFGWQWRIAAVCVALLLVLRVLAPFAIERTLEWYGEGLGLRIEAANIDLGVFAGTVSVEDLQIALSSDSVVGSEKPLLQMPLIHADLVWHELLFGRARLETLRLNAPVVSLTERADGTLALPQPTGDQANAESESQTQSNPVDPIEVERVVGSDEAASPNEGEPPVDEEASSRGLEIAIDRFELNSLEIALQRVGKESESVRFASTQFVLESLSFGSEGISVGDIGLDGPSLYVNRDWLLADRGGDASPSPADNASTTAPSMRLEHFALNDGVFRVRTDEGPVEITVGFETSDVEIAPDHMFPIELELASGNARIELGGRLGLAPLGFEGRLIWSGLDVPPYLLVTNPGLVPWIKSADASGEFDVVFTSGDGTGPAGLTLRGRTGLANLFLKDPESDELSLRANLFEVEVTEAVYPLGDSINEAPRIEVAALRVDAPHLAFTNPPDALDRFFGLYTGADEDTDDTETASDETATDAGAESPKVAPAVEPAESNSGGALMATITVDSIALTDGQLDITDRTVTPVHHTHIGELSVKGSGLELSPAQSAKSFEIEGMIQQKSTFALKGNLPDGTGDLDFSLTRLDLVAFDSFATQSGWHLNSGAASLDSKIRIGKQRYESNNELLIHDLSVEAAEGTGTSAMFGVPLNLALALLAGPSGEIALSVPLAWDSEGLGMGIASLVGSAFREALAGALASPLKLVGGLMPGDSGPPSLGSIAFEAGSSALGPAAMNRVEALAKLLVERPRLALEVSGQTSSADRPVLAHEMLVEDVVAGTPLPKVEDSGPFARRRVRAALSGLAEGREPALEPADASLLEHLVAARFIPPERVRALADKRAASVSDALSRSGAPAGSVHLGPPVDADSPAVTLGVRLRSHAEAGDSPDGSGGTPN